MLQPQYSNQSQKFLKKSEKILVKRLLKEIEELCVNPMPQNVKFLQGYKEKLYRARVGDYRIIYEVDYSKNRLGIVKIDKREKVYS